MSLNVDCNLDRPKKRFYTNATKRIPCIWCNRTFTALNRQNHCSPACKFQYYTDKTDDCWIWKGAVDSAGYGRLRTKNQYVIRAYRYSWLMHNGNIPDNMCVLHKCDNRLCVNPDHLSLGDHADNMADRNNKKRHAFGVKNASHKITEEQVRAIRLDNRQEKEIAKDYDMSYTHIGRIRNRRAWKHVI